jgi:hypothetical protein
MNTKPESTGQTARDCSAMGMRLTAAG